MTITIRIPQFKINTAALRGKVKVARKRTATSLRRLAKKVGG